jgi:hypothetical protein
MEGATKTNLVSTFTIKTRSPQGLKPLIGGGFLARLKPCPDENYL